MKTTAENKPGKTVTTVRTPEEASLTTATFITAFLRKGYEGMDGIKM